VSAHDALKNIENGPDTFRYEINAIESNICRTTKRFLYLICMDIVTKGAAKRLIISLFPIMLITGCAIAPYDPYSGYSAYNVPYGQGVYAAPPVYPNPGVTFGLGVHSGYGSHYGGHGGGHAGGYGGGHGGGHGR
jgi:hypothetical protein